MSVTRTLPAAFLLGVVLAGTISLGGVATTASAVPSPSDEHTLTQPDGTSFEATQWGNEYNHGWETASGYTITRGSDDWWRYATVEDGAVVPTDRRAAVDSPPPSVPKHVRGDAQGSPQLQTSTSDSADGPSLSSSGPDAASGMPATGSVNMPVVLINYEDTTTSYTTTDFQELVFGDDPAVASGPGSVRDYFQEASYGNLDITGGSAGVTGWETADESHDYYGSADIDSDAAKLAREAVRKSDDEMDYSEYDNDGDGAVDGVIVVHQGPGEEASGDRSDIWSHRWSFTGAGLDAYQTDDGVTVNSYSLQPETYGSGITTVGVIAHETGHLFGMTDLYDTTYQSEGIGDWGLMGGGSWNSVNRPGDSPAHPVAFHKSQQGWLTPAEQPLTGEMGVLASYTTNPEAFRWLDNPNGVETGGSGEYFLATNRRQTGFDSALPGQGVLLTHVDETRTDNDDASRKLVDVEAADGDADMDKSNNQGDAGDPFPGSTSAYAFDATSAPNSLLYDGSASGLTITDFLVDGSRITINPVPDPTVTPSPVDYGTVLYTGNESATVTVTNEGTEPLNVTSVTVEGEHASAFALEDGGGQRVVDPGASTTANVTFEPSARATYAATLSVAHNASGSPAEVSLTGTGGAPDIRVTPSPTVDFGNVSLAGGGQADVVVENNGTLPLNVTDANVTGANATAFSFANDSATPPSTVAPGASVTYTLDATADELAEYDATLELSHDAPDREPVARSLTATGVDRTPPAVESARAVATDDGASEVGPGASVTVSAAVTDTIGVESVTVDASALGGDTVALTDGNNNSVYDATVAVDTANATGGVHELPVEAVDTSGNANATRAAPLTLDLAPPAVDVTTPSEGWVGNDTSVEVSSTVTDDLTAVTLVEVRADGGAWRNATLDGDSWTAAFDGLEEGEHTVSVRATDSVSNTSPVETRNLTVDRSAPVLANASLARTDDVLPEEPVGVDVSASDDVSSVATVTADATELKADGGEWAGEMPAAPGLGEQTATVTVVDAAGNRNATTLAYDVGRDATLSHGNGSTYRATPAETPVISAVTLNATANAAGERVTVGTSLANPTGVPVNDDAALYFPQVNASVADEHVSSATVSLRLSKQRFDSLYVERDSVAFWALEDGAWTQVSANLTNVTADAYRYDVEATGLSAFAVTGDVEDERPSITSVSPGDGATTTDASPTIAASYEDGFSGVDASSVTLSVNGTPVESGLSVSASEVSYDASLGTGTHSATVAVSDEAGNTASRSWSFTVEEETAGSFGSGGGGGGGGAGGGGGGGGGAQSGGEQPTETTVAPTTTATNTTTAAATTTTEPATTATTASPTTTSNATTRATTRAPTTSATPQPSATTEETSSSAPGFGVGAAVLALVGAALLALRRDR